METTSCASHQKTVFVSSESSSQPSSEGEEFLPIVSACSQPTQEGFFVSVPAARRILTRRYEQKSKCEQEKFVLSQQKKFEEAKTEQRETEVRQNELWARLGAPLGVVLGLVVGGAITYVFLRK